MRKRWSAIAAGWILMATTAETAIGQCGTSGTSGIPQINISSDLWDSETTFSISQARPGAGWAWLMDLSPGPLPSAYGDLCVGPTFFFLFDFLGGGVPIGPAGDVSLTFDIPPAVGSAIGLPLYCQAIVLDPQGPGGIAISNDLSFEMRTQRVFVASDQGSVDILDGYANSTNLPATLGTGSLGSHADFAMSRDGERLFTRLNGPGVANGVRCYDVTQSPPQFLGDAIANGNSLSGIPRNGVVISHDDAFGYFVDNGFVHEFDADPNSPMFLTVTRSATSSVAGISIDISNDDKTLFVSAGTGSPSLVYFYDRATLVEFGSGPLGNAQPLLGLVLRYGMAVSPDGRFLATMQMGAYVGSPQIDGNASISIVSLDPTDPMYLQEVTFIPLPLYGQLQVVYDPSDPSQNTLLTLGSDGTGAMFVQEIDLAAQSIKAHPVGVGNGLGVEEGGIATSPNGSFVYVACRGDDSVHTFERSTMTKVSSQALASGGRAWFIHVDQ